MEQTRSRHVLIVGWDGVRDDERRAARTPHLDGLGARGFSATVRVHEKNPTISGPVWTTVATGVHSDRHGVRDNDLGPYDPVVLPDVLTRVRRAIPDATTFAAATWAPLVSADSGGPVFGMGYLPAAVARPAGTEAIAAAPAADVVAGVEAMAAADSDVIARTVIELQERDHAALFSYLELPDAIGHLEGVTPRYRAAIEACDVHLGVLLAAIDARPNRESEDWLILVTTDHGHRDEGHHGGDSDEERSAWLVAAGPGVDAASGHGVDHADIPVTALTFLGIGADGSLAGMPFGTRTTT